MATMRDAAAIQQKNAGGIMQWKTARRIALYTIGFILYLISTVPVGLFLYSVKTEAGVDIFTSGGFHAYMRCLSTSFPLHGSSERPPAEKQRKL